MRSCLGSVLLIILVAVIALTAFYQWETNSRIEFSSRGEGDPALNKTTVPIEKVAPKKDPRTILEQNVMKMEAPTEPSDLVDDPSAQTNGEKASSALE